MRVLFVVVAGLPHLYPLVPLAWAFRLAGHEVRFASSGSVEQAIVHSGLPAVVIPGNGPVLSATERADLVRDVYSQPPWPRDYGVHRHLLDADQRGLLTRLGQYMVAASEALVDGLVSFAQEWKPDIVVHDAITYAGAVTAAVLGVPGVRHLFGTASYPRLELTPTEPLPEYVRLFERLGVSPVEPAMIVDPTPPSMRQTTATPSLDMRYVPYNGAGLVPDWLATPRQRPRVCVTWGVTNEDSLGSAAADPFQDAISVAAEMDMDVVVMTGTPLQYVLPYCDLIVQQGGDGTTLTAASFGVPQLAVSRKPDAELAPARLAATGAGVHLRYQDRPSRDVLREAMAVLRSDRCRAAAARLRAEIEAQPAPAEVVRDLEKL